MTPCRFPPFLARCREGASSVLAFGCYLLDEIDHSSAQPLLKFYECFEQGDTIAGRRFLKLTTIYLLKPSGIPTASRWDAGRPYMNQLGWVL
jgi:hypothetical protein